MIPKRDYLKEIAQRYGYNAFLMYIILLLPLLRLKDFTIEQGMNVIIPTLIQDLYSGLGVLCCYLLFLKCSYVFESHNRKVVQTVHNVSSISMGIYIIHQFILKTIYYCTPIPQWFGSYILPWLGFAVVLLLSVIIAILLKKTKVGTFLLG